MNNKGATYKDSSVDIQAGYEFVKRIKGAAKATYGPEVLGDLGSFGALYALGQDYPRSGTGLSTDGVGTKLKVLYGR